jgi:hypothetical protein
MVIIERWRGVVIWEEVEEVNGRMRRRVRRVRSPNCLFGCLLTDEAE